MANLRADVAWMELTKLIPTLFNRFDMELTKPGWTVDDAYVPSDNLLSMTC